MDRGGVSEYLPASERASEATVEMAILAGGGILMKARLRRWARGVNWYVVAFFAGIFGLFDALTPGPAPARLLGLTIMAGAAWVWLLDGGR